MTIDELFASYEIFSLSSRNFRDSRRTTLGGLGWLKIRPALRRPPAFPGKVEIYKWLRGRVRL